MTVKKTLKERMNAEIPHAMLGDDKIASAAKPRCESLLYRATISLMAMLLALIANAANPYLPLWEYIPDGEPYVFDDPDDPGKQRIYIYGSHDKSLETRNSIHFIGERQRKS